MVTLLGNLFNTSDELILSWYETSKKLYKKTNERLIV